MMIIVKANKLENEQEREEGQTGNGVRQIPISLSPRAINNVWNVLRLLIPGFKRA